MIDCMKTLGSETPSIFYFFFFFVLLGPVDIKTVAQTELLVFWRVVQLISFSLHGNNTENIYGFPSYSLPLYF